MTLRAVITDWGGVLTSPLNQAIPLWLAADGIDVAHYKQVMRDLVQDAYSGNTALATANLIHQLEDGSLAPAEFERLLALELRTVEGEAVPAEGLLDRMFAEFAPVEHMYETILGCRTSGLLTALLSNSWGNTYPRERWAELFDAVVISGEVGMRKPAPEIFEHAVTLLGVKAEECVFIDDIAANITAAEELGMTGVLHTDPVETRARLGDLFSITLP